MIQQKEINKVNKLQNQLRLQFENSNPSKQQHSPFSQFDWSSSSNYLCLAKKNASKKCTKIVFVPLFPSNFIKPEKHEFIDDSKRNLRLFTSDLDLTLSYDLPFKQLQYTKTRKNKQNLIPIFQELSTTHNRCQNHKNKTHDRFDRSDRYLILQNQSPINQSRQRSRNLSQNFKNTDKGTIFSFGQFAYQSENKQTAFDYLNTVKNERNLDFLNQNRIRKVQVDSNLYQNQRIQKFLDQTFQKLHKIQDQIKQSQQRVETLKKEVYMHKQKNLLKQQQIYFFDHQNQRLLQKSKELQQSLRQRTEKYNQIETAHHLIHNQLKKKKQELKKQENWLKEENLQIKAIEGKFQKILKMIRNLQEEEQQKVAFWEEIQNESSKNIELNQQLQQMDEKLISLTQQNRVIEEQTETLQMHEQQLINLQSKFRKQTQTLNSTLSELTEELLQKKQDINQENQIDSIIRDLQLEVGQMNERKINLDQEIHEIHLTISLKKRNIKYIQNRQPDRRQYMKQISDKQDEQEIIDLRNQKTFCQPKTISQTLKHPLPTIRQQSKNTSAYQSPKKQIAYRQDYQGSVEIDPHGILRTSIFKAHNQQPQRKAKKYHIIESQSEVHSNPKSSYCFNEIKNKNKFAEKQEKTSIEHRLFDDDDDFRLNTDNGDKRSYSVQLSSLFPEQNFSKNKKIAQQSKSNKKEQNQAKAVEKNQNQTNLESEDVLESLIERYQHIKSNSLFDDTWRQKI